MDEKAECNQSTNQPTLPLTDRFTFRLPLHSKQQASIHRAPTSSVAELDASSHRDEKKRGPLKLPVSKPLTVVFRVKARAPVAPALLLSQTAQEKTKRKVIEEHGKHQRRQEPSQRGLGGPTRKTWGTLSFFVGSW